MSEESQRLESDRQHNSCLQAENERLKEEVRLLTESLRQSDAINSMTLWEEEKPPMKNVLINGHKIDPAQSAFTHLQFHLDSSVEAGWKGVIDTVHARLKQLENQQTAIDGLVEALKTIFEIANAALEAAEKVKK